LLFVLNGSEIQSFTFRVEDELQLTGNKVIWKILGPMKDEVSGQFRILHKKELHDNISHLLLLGVKSRKTG
jgi:hypothetical protein